MKLMLASVVVVSVVAMCGRANGEKKQQGDGGALRRELLHRMYLSDGSWAVINTPFPADEKRKETLPVHVHRYPKDAYTEKETDKCLWISEHLTSMEYVPKVDRFYALAKETEDHIFIFFTWNAQHCTLDKRTGRILQKGDDDEPLKGFDSLVPLKLFIWRRATARIHPVNRVDPDDDPFADL